MRRCLSISGLDGTASRILNLSSRTVVDEGIRVRVSGLATSAEGECIRRVIVKGVIGGAFPTELVDDDIEVSFC